MADKIAVDDELIRRLARLLEETGLSEIEISEGTQHVRVARGNFAAAPAAVAATPAVDSTAINSSAVEIDSGHPGAVTAPIVGTLYLAPEPGAAPFVEVGGTVEEGDTMFIIEAMKTMNPVRAPRGGTVARVLVSNETPVEYGEVLALVE